MRDKRQVAAATALLVKHGRLEKAHADAVAELIANRQKVAALRARLISAAAEFSTVHVHV